MQQKLEASLIIIQVRYADCCKTRANFAILGTINVNSNFR